MLILGIRKDLFFIVTQNHLHVQCNFLCANVAMSKPILTLAVILALLIRKPLNLIMLASLTLRNWESSVILGGYPHL